MTIPQTQGGGAPAFEMRHRLERALEVAGISREQMAVELDVHRNTISNYLNGRTSPPRAVLIAWHLRTGVPLRWLELGEDGGGGPSVPVTLGYTDRISALYHAELVAA